ncbi:DUF416 family protein [Dyella mobilis]|uniref:DUF416 family protein n=1 Tax=Dyella mobilis TaxID=1849582 RepID=A0ABS2KGS2_9GAMM|nr:DUF416 family protein [Dyella mobilis]MBM7129578.1 DUF416 family protein [Dyella mobilis]GLQ98158.1 hypothetical protein GCM10007863_25780 [Dyella mobilis]
MNILIFDEPSLVQRLSTLQIKSAITFALCCATRQLNAYEAYADKFAPEARAVPRRIVEKLWEFVDSAKSDDTHWSEQLKIVESLYPEEQTDWAPLHIYSEHTLYSLTYVIRCLMTCDVQEAAYAARVAYIAADQAAIRAIEESRDSLNFEQLVLASDVVQKELRRQSDDLGALEIKTDALVLQLRSFAFASQILTVSEMLV